MRIAQDEAPSGFVSLADSDIHFVRFRLVASSYRSGRGFEAMPPKWICRKRDDENRTHGSCLYSNSDRRLARSLRVPPVGFVVIETPVPDTSTITTVFSVRYNGSNRGDGVPGGFS